MEEKNLIDNLSPDSTIGNLGRNFLKINVNQNMKMSFKNSANSCRCDSEPECKYYCSDCKVLTCTKCHLEEHKKHVLLQKNFFKFSMENINKTFEPVEAVLAEVSNFHSGKGIKTKILQNIDKFISDLEEKVKKFRENQIEEIKNIFETYEKNVEGTKQKIVLSKTNLLKHYEKTKKFFLLDETEKEKSETSSEQTNLVFLVNYDLLYLSQNHSLDIAKLIKQMTSYIEALESKQLDAQTNYLKQFDNIFFSQKKEDVTNKNDLLTKDKYFDNCNKLAEDHYKDIHEKVNKSTAQIETFKKTVFNVIKRDGNYKEFVKTLDSLENSKTKGAENLFSKRRPANAGGTKDSKTIINKEASITVTISKKEDVCLNSPILEKYFAFQMIKMYNQNFGDELKKEQTSHTDMNFKMNDEQKKYQKIGKIKEGTSDIIVYDNKFKKLEKFIAPLKKNPHGYTKFPVGCRGLLVHNDRFYITGGKDETRTFPNVLVFFTKKKNLVRMTDLRIPRSHHTIIFNEILNTVMVIGGENQASVEILDPVTNRWLLLPDLFYPRANPYFLFDEANGLMYTMFGSEGEIRDNIYSDVIEFLDLTKIKEGWQNLDYNNKSTLNLRSYLNVVPLNNEILLLYGGISPRGSKKTVCVLNLAKGEIGKVDKALIASLRKAKMTDIISSITINNEA